MSETGNLKLKKHDNPETNTEKFDIENYLNGNWDKIDDYAKEVNTEISNINSNNTELEKELKEAQEDFYQNSIRGQARGEYIHVEDSSNCRAKIGINGNSEQETRSGKNKLNSASIGVGTNNGITCTYDSKTGIITFNGACNTDNTRFTFENTSIPFTNNLTKTLAYYVSGSITTYCLFRTFDSEWSAGETLNLLDLSSSKNKTRIISSNTTIKTNIDIRFNNGSVANNFQIKLMITDSENDDYEQYGASPSPDYPSEVDSCGDNGSINEVICNKNLFDKDNAIKEYELDGTTGKIMSNSLYFTSDYIRVNPNEQYYLSGKKAGNSNCFYNKDKKFISRINLENGLLTVPDDLNIYYLRFNSRLTAIDTTMLEKNTKKSAYEEHQEQSYIMPTQQPMRAIGDIRDTFIKKNNKWYEHHSVIRKIFDGTEDWNLYTSDNARRFGLSITGNIPKLITTTYNGMFGKGLCSHFGTQMNYTTTDLILFVQIANPIWYIGITDFNSKWANVTALKEWLSSQYNAGTPAYLDYVLEEPLDIECTEEQSKILDELNNARTYKNVTNIYSTDEISPILSLDYAKDLETLLNNTQALAVNNASEGV